MVMGDMVMTVDIVVIGSGPGGYSAAFRAADLGFDVALVDPRPKPGGAYLYEGCIPSKSYLFLTQLLLETKKARAMGVHFSKAEIDLKQMISWKNQVVENLAANLLKLSSQKGVLLIQGRAFFENSTTVRLKDSEIARLHFKYAIIATGSVPLMFPGTVISPNSRIMNSTAALNFTTIPEKMLIIGSGYEALELGTIYAALGCTIHLAEQQKQLLPGTDEDLIQPLTEHLSLQFEQILLQTTITKLTENKEDVQVEMQTPDGTESHRYDHVLIAMGHQANSGELGLKNTSVELSEGGFIQTDSQQRTAESNIFAVGDVADSRMFAHTAIREGRVAAEVIAGHPSAFDVRAIPNIIYTSPQIAYCGLSENEARKQNIPVITQTFPWKYSARAHTLGATDGLTKIIANPKDGRIIGAGITGRGAEDLISEWILAIEMGARAEDVALCLHGHPTLSEAGGYAAEFFLIDPTDLLLKH